MKKAIARVENIIVQNAYPSGWKDNSEDTACLNKTESVQSEQVARFCRGCGSKLNPGACFCGECGTEVTQNQPMAEPANEQENVWRAESIQAQSIGPVSKKEFIEKYASPGCRKDIKSTAILCYVCVGITTILSLAVNPIGFIDALILLGLALGMHLGKSKVCAILILIYSCLNAIIGLVTTGSVTGWMIIITGVFAVKTFNKIEKEYKEFQSGKFGF